MAEVDDKMSMVSIGFPARHGTSILQPCDVEGGRRGGTVDGRRHEGKGNEVGAMPDAHRGAF